MSDKEQMKDNIHTFSELPDVDEHEKKIIKQAAALLRQDVSLPCTGCRYCVPNCPMELDIPTLLVAYNDMKADASWRLVNLLGLPEDKRPSACIECGACTAHCPQALPVPEAMREMSEIIEKF